MNVMRGNRWHLCAALALVSSLLAGAPAVRAAHPSSGDGLVAPAAPRTPTPRTQLKVDDPAAVGAVGDGLLSLAEAIRLANGELAPAALSVAERKHVRGTPGHEVPDLIQVVVPKVLVPYVAPPPPGDALSPGTGMAATPLGHQWEQPALPKLVGNDGDTIDGNGVLLVAESAAGSGEEGVGGLAFFAASSGLTIRGFTVQRFVNVVEIFAPDGRGLHDVVITRNDFDRGGGIFMDATGRDGVPTTLERIAITDNVLTGGDVSERAAAGYQAGLQLWAAYSGDPVADNADFNKPSIVRDLDFSRNQVSGTYVTSIHAGAASASGATDVWNGHLENVRFAGNTFRHLGPDPVFNMWAVIATLAGRPTYGRIKNLQILDNDIETVNGDAQIIDVGAVGGSFGESLAHDGRWDGLVIRGNQMRHCTVGVLVTGIIVEIGAGTLYDGTMSDVDISDNHITDCQVGVVAAAAWDAVGPAAAMTGAGLRSVRVTDNRITDVVYGVIAAGGAAVAYSGPDGLSSPGSGVVQNLAEDVVIERNSISASLEGIRLHGGFVGWNRGSVVAQNRIADAAARNNTVTAPTACLASADGTTGTDAVLAIGNNLTNTSCEG